MPWERGVILLSPFAQSASDRVQNREPWLRAGDIAFSALICFLLAAVPLAFHAHPYFRDDMQAEYMPTYYVIGQSLLRGELPLFTLHSWIGGNLAGEFQYDLFNPVMLGLFAALPLFDKLIPASAFLSMVLLAIFGSGIFAFARALQIRRDLCYVGAVAGSTNNFVFY